MKIQSGRSRAYKIFSIIVLVILAILFLFPLYWILTGTFKPAQDIYAQKPVLGEDGKEHTPVVIHRAILGSFDRFLSFLIEETKGAFPMWLAPVQVKILPITDAHMEYAKAVCEQLQKEGIRVELDDRNEKIGYKIREAQLEKVPYMLVVGQKEMEEKTVGVRSRKEGDIGAVKVSTFVENVREEIKSYGK